MLEHKLIKVQENDPNRCQGMTKNGQCQFRSHEESKFCLMHGGGKTKTNEKDRQLRNYRFQKYQGRVNEFADNDQVKSLREELGVLRMIMEETVNRCQESADILIYSSKIADLATKIERLVVSCHKLETSLGQTLNKTVVLNIATRMVNIISQYVPSEEIINQIVADIGKMVEES